MRARRSEGSPAPSTQQAAIFGHKTEPGARAPVRGPVGDVFILIADDARVTLERPKMDCKSVDLPAPFDPCNTTSSPAPTVSDAPNSACAAPSQTLNHGPAVQAWTSSTWNHARVAASHRVVKHRLLPRSAGCGQQAVDQHQHPIRHAGTGIHVVLRVKNGHALWASAVTRAISSARSGAANPAAGSSSSSRRGPCARQSRPVRWPAPAASSHRRQVPGVGQRQSRRPTCSSRAIAGDPPRRVPARFQPRARASAVISSCRFCSTVRASKVCATWKVHAAPELALRRPAADAIVGRPGGLRHGSARAGPRCTQTWWTCPPRSDRSAPRIRRGSPRSSRP